MGRGALDADVAAAHDARLAAVEGEFELALEDDAVVDGHGAVEGGLEAGAEVDEADDGAVGNVEAGLDGEVSGGGGREGGGGEKHAPRSPARIRRPCPRSAPPASPSSNTISPPRPAFRP